MSENDEFRVKLQRAKTSEDVEDYLDNVDYTVETIEKYGYETEEVFTTASSLDSLLDSIDHDSFVVRRTMSEDVDFEWRIIVYDYYIE